MKKTILLATMVASLVTVAKTTGSVEFFNENTATFEKGDIKVNKLETKTEVKVDGTGLSFGGEFKAKNLEFPFQNNDVINKSIKLLADSSSVFLKYELPEIKGINSFVKGTLKAKDMATTLEANADYKIIDNVKVGLNSATEFSTTENPLSTKIYSTHKLFTKAFEDKKNEKGFKFRNINANIEANHTYENVNKLKYISASTDGTYAVNKDLDLTGKFRFRYNFDANDANVANSDFKDQYLGDKDLFNKFDDNKNFSFIHAYSLNATYKGISNTEINGTGFVHHFLKTDNYVNYGILADVKYTGINNLTLTGKTTLSGLSKVASEHNGLFRFVVGAKYDYKITDKFTVFPEFNADAKLYVNGTRLTNASLSLTPKIGAEYKPVDNLTIKGSIATPVIFENPANTNINAFNYDNTSLKTSLNIKYTW